MNKFIDKILREAEDSSDDFFQPKHVEKRKEDFKREFDKKKRGALSKLIKGLEEIKIVYKNKDWKDEKERLFLELFSKLHVDAKFYKSDYRYGYFLSDSNDIKTCFYDLKSNRFWIDYASIWRVFETRFDMNDDDIQSFIDKLLKEHFKLYDVTTELSLSFFDH